MDRLKRNPDFVARETTPDDIAAYVAGLAPEEPVRPGLISNPMAQTNWRSVAHKRLFPLMPDPLAVLSTPSPDDLEWALEYLLFQRRINVLAVNGGDGTIHHTLNALVRVLDAQEETVPSPTLLFLNGGGMNMVARAHGTRHHPGRTLRRFLDGASTMGRLRTRESALLEVRESNGDQRVGFIFGSELVHNALTMYERFGRGYRGLTRFFSELGRGYLFKGKIWQQYGHLITPPETALTLDDETLTDYAAVVASTIPMTLLRDLIRTLDEAANPGQMNTIVVRAREPGQILRTIPFLLAGRSGPGFTYRSKVSELMVDGPYTLDGECFSRARGQVVVKGSTRTMRGIVS